MTVAELIAELQTHPPSAPVVINYHSEWAEAHTVGTIEGRENGGYVSSIYRPEDRLHKRTFVYID